MRNRVKSSSPSACEKALRSCTLKHRRGKVVDTGIRPVVTTGIAHKEAGIGQIGPGIVRLPMDCCVKAVLALAERMQAV
jgi:hypothetical protein